MRKKGYIKIISQNFFLFKRSWVSYVLLMLLEPVLYLSAFGYGVGQFINNINGQSYMEFFFAGFLCVSTAVIAFLDSHQTQQNRLSEEKIYTTWLTTPLTKFDIFLGEVLWSSAKGLMGAIAVCIVGLIFGIEMGYFILPAILILSITAFMFACLGSLLATTKHKIQSSKIPTFALLVSTVLISGILFPIQLLSLPLLILSYLVPLTHSLQLSRLILNGNFDYLMLVHFVYLLFSSYAIFYIAFRKFKEKVLN